MNDIYQYDRYYSEDYPQISTKPTMSIKPVVAKSVITKPTTKKNKWSDVLVVGIAGVAIIYLLTKNVAAESTTTTQPPGTTTTQPPYGTLILEDNFNGTSLDTNKWSTPSGTWSWSWTDLDRNNVSVTTINNVSMARLKISTATTGKPYRGCIIENNIQSIRYGKCEVRARLPPGNKGIVGYILLWPTSGWPPEIDFVETSGYTANAIYFTQHWDECKYTGNPNDYCRNIQYYNHLSQYFLLNNIDVTQWHIYSVEVTQTSMKWYVDNQLKTTQTNYSPNDNWTFGAGIWAGNCTGGWGGCPTGNPFPQYMDIDYVRLWKY